MNSFHKLFLLSSILLFSLQNIAFAENIKHQSSQLVAEEYTHFTSGTGFFVSPTQLVTNEHVVQGCKAIKIRGAVTPTYAEIESIDKVNDLALLKTETSVAKFAPLRDKQDIKRGERVVVMGYPLEHGIDGSYMIKTATVTDPNDSFDGINRIQFTDSVEKGNSGGPLLDPKGNVIGVIVGKMSFYLANSEEEIDSGEAKPVKTSSMAISLDSLKGFLAANKVYYNTNKEDTENSSSSTWLEENARDYIVNVHCIKD